MAVTTKTSLGLDLIDVSTEKLEDSRVKISANFQLIHNLFVSNTAYLLGAPIASASTTTIGSVGSGDTKHVTGTTTITSFGVSTTGVKKTLIFDGILTITHNATSLMCLGGVNIVTAVGDIAEFQCVDGATAKWMCTSYTRKSGQPLFVEDKLGTPIVSAATTTIGTAGLGDYIHITGTTTITSFGIATTAGIRRTLIFDGALTLTHNATSLICMGGGSITTVAGMIIEVEAETTANWRVVSITHPNVSPTELGYLDGVTGNIQTQFNAKSTKVTDASSVTVTVGTSGNYTTLRGAIDYLCNNFNDNRKAGFKAKIVLQSDFTLNEQIVLSNSELGWITITSNGVTIPVTMQSTTTPVPKTIWAEGLEFGTYNTNAPTFDLFNGFGGYGSCFIFIGGTAPTFFNVVFQPDASWTLSSKWLMIAMSSKVSCFKVTTLATNTNAMGFMQTINSIVLLNNCNFSSNLGTNNGLIFTNSQVEIGSCILDCAIKGLSSQIRIYSSSLFKNCATAFVYAKFQTCIVDMSTVSIWETRGDFALFLNYGTSFNGSSITFLTSSGGTSSSFVLSSNASTQFTDIIFDFSARALTNSYAVGGLIIAEDGGKVILGMAPTITGTAPTLLGGATFYRVNRFSQINLNYADTQTANIAFNTVTTSGIIIK